MYHHTIIHIRFALISRTPDGNNVASNLHACMLCPTRYAECVCARQQTQHVGGGIVQAYTTAHTAALLLGVDAVTARSQTGCTPCVLVIAGDCQLALQLHCMHRMLIIASGEQATRFTICASLRSVSSMSPSSMYSILAGVIASSIDVMCVMSASRLDEPSAPDVLSPFTESTLTRFDSKSSADSALVAPIQTSISVITFSTSSVSRVLFIN